ncbi:GH3 auxin-responsive promoter family protein [Chloroflexota bacterium]
MSDNSIFRVGSNKQIWQKFCGFLDLSVEEFMEIQEQLLLEEIKLIAPTPIGKNLINGETPESVAQFREAVPLTTYDDYAPFLSERKEDALAENAYFWGHTSGRSGAFKWVPYTRRAYERISEIALAGIILACADRKGEINIAEGDRVLYNIPPKPYLSGIVASGFSDLFKFRFIPPIEEWENMDFQERIEKGFKMALRTGVDILGSMSSILVRMGEVFTERSMHMKFSPFMLHPAVLLRLTRALIRSRVQGRPILPKDLWQVKAILGTGMDTSIFKDKVVYYWGRIPHEYYGATEVGAIAVQSWDKRNSAMCFVPHAAFYEFIPEEEWLKANEDEDYSPPTILLDQVEVGKRYEIVVTNFYGMPFLRYRLGDLIEIVSLNDQETGINLPQMVFEARSDGIIDIAGFTRLDEKTVWQAITNTEIKHKDWTIRKEYSGDKPVLHLYIELSEAIDSEEVKRRIDESLVAVDSFYADLSSMLDIHPLRVTVLPNEAFQRYYEQKRAAGLDLAWLKPPHMNASDDVIEDLLSFR